MTRRIIHVSRDIEKNSVIVSWVSFLQTHWDCSSNVPVLINVWPKVVHYLEHRTVIWTSQMCDFKNKNHVGIFVTLNELYRNIVEGILTRHLQCAIYNISKMIQRYESTSWMRPICNLKRGKKKRIVIARRIPIFFTERASGGSNQSGSL